MIRGRLAQVWGLRQATQSKGWSDETLHRYLPLLDPVGPPVLDPANIVTVLGSRDDVTPFASGLALIDRWQVPEQNRFIWNRGHFTVPLTMMRDHAPLRCFKAVLDRLAGG